MEYDDVRYSFCMHLASLHPLFTSSTSRALQPHRGYAAWHEQPAAALVGSHFCPNAKALWQRSGGSRPLSSWVPSDNIFATEFRKQCRLSRNRAPETWKVEKKHKLKSGTSGRWEVEGLGCSLGVAAGYGEESRDASFWHHVAEPCPRSGTRPGLQDGTEVLPFHVKQASLGILYHPLSWNCTHFQFSVPLSTPSFSHWNHWRFDTPGGDLKRGRRSSTHLRRGSFVARKSSSQASEELEALMAEDTCIEKTVHWCSLYISPQCLHNGLTG